MTTSTKKPTVTAKVEGATKAPARKRTPAKTTTPRATKAKEAVVETPVASEPVVEQNNDVEDVIIAEEKEFDIPTEDEELATELGAEEKEAKVGSANYTISEESFNYTMLNGSADNQWPLGIWTRNPTTLEGLQDRSLERMMEGNARPSDYLMVDFAEQNSIVHDKNMMSFYAREGARWNNYLPVGDRRLRNSKVNYAGGSVNGNTERVVAALMRTLDLGVPIIVRLWHSGIVFSINPSDKAERISLVDQLNSAHLATLRRTNGLIHGTSAYYSNRIIINEFMRHVTSSNLDRSLWPQIINLMDHRDIQFMAWGLMAAAHPRGYKLVEQCGGLKALTNAEGEEIFTDDGKVKKAICGHKKESIIDFNLICQIDDSCFTSWQKEFISRKIDENNPATLDDIKKYQSMGDMHKEERIEIDDNLSIVTKAPSANLHIEIGEEWIESVENCVDQIINVNTDDETKSGYVTRQLEATAALDVAHWVTSFDLSGEIIDDRAGINRIFRSLGNNQKRRDEIFDSIRARMSKRLAATIAIPTFKCPHCQNMSHEIENNGTAFYTPIDMVSRFFTLTARNQ